MSNLDETKHRKHPWRSYGSPISKQWGATNEAPKPIPGKAVKKKKHTQD